MAIRVKLHIYMKVNSFFFEKRFIKIFKELIFEENTTKAITTTNNKFKSK